MHGIIDRLFSLIVSPIPAGQRWSCLHVLCVLLFMLWTPAIVLADPMIDAAKEQVDAVLLIDASGSMRITDPLKLRSDGARLFTQFLRAGDRLAIVEFSAQTKILRPLLDYTPEQEADVTRTIGLVGDAGEFTDLQAALVSAQAILKDHGRSDAEQVIILLSDGKLDPAPSQGTTEELSKKIFEELLPDFKSTGTKVYTLSFSEQADKDLLAQIAAGASGMHWFTPSADKIHESFADLFVVVKKPQMVPLTAKGFKIDQDIQEATFYVNRETEEQVTLVSPSGEKFSESTKQENLKWFQGQKFDVITVENPESGQWQIIGLPKNEGFATLLTNLKLTTSWPSSITSGEPALLEVRLYESRKPVVLPEMTDVVRYAFQITPTDKVSEPVIRELLVDDGTHGDRIARDGIFSSAVILEDAGEHKLRVLASGPTFERHQQLAFRVKPRLVTLQIVEASEALSAKPGDDSASKEYFVQAQLSSEITSMKKIEVELIATDKENKRLKMPLTKVDDTYEVSLKKLPHDGEFTLRATVTAEGPRKRTVRGDSQLLNYVKVSAPGEESVVEIVTVTEDDKPVEAEPVAAGFPWVYLIILIAINGGIGAYGIKTFKSEETGQEDHTTAEFAPLAPLLAAVAELEKRSKVTEVNLDDPIFTDENLATAPELPARSGAAQSTPSPDSDTDEESSAEESEDEATSSTSDETADELLEDLDGGDTGAEADDDENM